MRFAVGHVDDPFVDEDAVGPGQLALQRIAHRAVAALTCTEHGGDHAALQVDAANGVALGVGDVDSAVAGVGNSLRAGELRHFSVAAIAGVALLARGDGEADVLYAYAVPPVEAVRLAKMRGVALKTTLHFDKELKKNGSIELVEVGESEKVE